MMAASFDSSCAISSMVKWEKEKGAVYEMFVNEKCITAGEVDSLPFSIEKLIAFSSDFHTLKIGDFLFCGHRHRFRNLRRGDCLQMTLNGVKMLDFRIS